MLTTNRFGSKIEEMSSEITYGNHILVLVAGTSGRDREFGKRNRHGRAEGWCSFKIGLGGNPGQVLISLKEISRSFEFDDCTAPLVWNMGFYFLYFSAEVMTISQRAFPFPSTGFGGRGYCWRRTRWLPVSIFSSFVDSLRCGQFACAMYCKTCGRPEHNANECYWVSHIPWRSRVHASALSPLSMYCVPLTLACLLWLG
jgi:hypothetical protein